MNLDDEDFEKEIEAIACSMETAYRANNNRENACIDVAAKHPAAPIMIIRGMWEAIDAFVDINQVDY